MRLKNVESHLLFPIPIWYVEYEDFESVNQAILDEIAKIDWDAEHERRGLRKTAADRYDEDAFFTPELVPSAREILEAFLHNCNRIGLEMGWDLTSNEIRISDLWAHMTPPGKSTQLHHHLPAQLSAAYYVRVPKGSGSLRFVDDRKHRVVEPRTGKADAVTSHHAEVPAKEGRMVIFPAWLSHQVLENRSTEMRVSLSFNAVLIPKDGVRLSEESGEFRITPATPG